MRCDAAHIHNVSIKYMSLLQKLVSLLKITRKNLSSLFLFTRQIFVKVNINIINHSYRARSRSNHNHHRKMSFFCSSGRDYFAATVKLLFEGGFKEGIKQKIILSQNSPQKFSHQSIPTFFFVDNFFLFLHFTRKTRKGFVKFHVIISTTASC